MGRSLAMLSGIALAALLSAGCARPSIDEGRTLYQENGCGSCHGPEGHGDGPLAANLPAKPVDFRDISQFKRGTSMDDIAKTLAQGIAITHTMPALQITHHMLVMPQFDHLTKTQRRSIALYVISLRTQNPPRSAQP